MKLIIVLLAGILCLGRANAQSAGGEIPLQRDGGVFLTKVTINNAITLDFILDSGAADVAIPVDVFLTLTRTGTIIASDIHEERSYANADGVITRQRTFTIRSLKLGSITIHNVQASVGAAASPLLLGQSFLQRFGGWSIDNSRQVLVLKQGGEAVPPIAQAPTSTTAMVSPPRLLPPPRPIRPAPTDSGNSLRKALRLQGYWTAWALMLSTSDAVPEWILTFSRDLDSGTEAYSLPIVVAGHTYEMFRMCKPHSCGVHELVAFYSGDGAQFVGIVLMDEERTAFLGRPADAHLRSALKAAITDRAYRGDCPPNCIPVATPVTTAPVAQPPQAVVPISVAFNDGLRDRQDWETWFARTVGDFSTGAAFWAGQRSLTTPLTCETLASDFMVAGCRAAKQRLMPTDLRRKSDADYRAGWNSFKY